MSNGARGEPDGVENGGLQRAARLETRNFFRRNANRVSRPRIPAVALGAAADHEGPEAANGDAAAAAQRIEHAAHEGLERLLRGDLRSAGGLRHRGDEIGLGHALIYPMRWREVKTARAQRLRRSMAASRSSALKGFSSTAMRADWRNVHAPGLAVSPVMKRKRPASAGCAATASR